MRTALYECDLCNDTQLWREESPGAGFPDHECGCGAMVGWKKIWCGDPRENRPIEGWYGFVKGRPYQWSETRGVPNIARHIRSDQEQLDLHARKVAAAKDAAREARKTKAGRDNPFQHIGKVPLEAYENAVEQTGNKSWWQEDTEDKLKRTPFWLGE